MSRRVVVTGLGVVSPVGNDVDTFWNAITTGASGIDRVTAFDISAFTCQIGGEVKNFDPLTVMEPKEAKRTDRFILFAVAAARQAIKDSGLDLQAEDLTKIATIIGSGIGGMKTMEDEVTKLNARGPSRVSPFMIPMMISDMAAGRTAIEFGLKGPNYSVVSACASGSHSLGDALMMIKTGMCDVAVSGGTEATITPVSFAGFCSMKAMSTRNDTPKKASSPFDSKRDGFVMSEGAGIVILEELEHALARGAKIYAEFIGYGASADAHHISTPAPGGDGMARAMQMALNTANIKPTDVQYINAHGTSTDYNDRFESMAITTVFGEHATSKALNVSSTKSTTGHLLGAAGGVEFIASVLAVKNDLVPPTINLEDPDPELTLNYTPNVAVKKTVTTAMSNSFGFGGHNASVIVTKYVGK